MGMIVYHDHRSFVIGTFLFQNKLLFKYILTNIKNYNCYKIVNFLTIKHLNILFYELKKKLLLKYIYQQI